MNVRYKKEANAAYMIMGGQDECEEYAARMLQENRIRGVMPLAVREVNGVKEYYFDISSGRSMSGVLEKRPVTLYEVRSFLYALAEMVDQMEEYLMNVGHLLLEPGMICLPADAGSGDADFRHAVFCCHPAVERDFLGQVRELMQYFLNKMDHMEEQSLEKAYELFRISQKEYFRIEEMLAVCNSVPVSTAVTRRSPIIEPAPNPFDPMTPEEAEAAEEKDSGRTKRGRRAESVPLGSRLRTAFSVICMILGCGLAVWSLWSRMAGAEQDMIAGYSFWLGIAFLAVGAVSVLTLPQPENRRRVREAGC